ncbi:MAG TPA: GAF domain-containing protein, partial [Burkholderiaceae bacterium]|nr:GAF domain-containing protein [Burkholderiaceae bacterium]
MTGPKNKPKPGTRTPAATGASDALVRRQRHRATAAADAAMPRRALALLARLGRHLHEPRDPHALHELVVTQTVSLTGAQRVLLVLEAPAGRRLAGARVPTGEAPDALLRAIAPWLDAARHSRAAALRHGPDGAAAAAQRSCLVTPLIRRRELLGYLYADIDGTHGRFTDAQRDLLALLADQAAAALANLRAIAVLDAKVAERSAELEQRSDALAL